jgi:hypothetical protein
MGRGFGGRRYCLGHGRGCFGNAASHRRFGLRAGHRGGGVGAERGAAVLGAFGGLFLAQSFRASASFAALTAFSTAATTPSATATTTPAFCFGRGGGIGSG